MLAYSVDTDGDEVFTLRFAISTPIRIYRTRRRAPTTAAHGASDSTAFFYTVHDELYRPYQAWRHKIDTDCHEDVLVYEESDARFDLMIRDSTSGDVVFIESESRDTSEVRYVVGDSEPVLIRERRTGIEYSVDHDPAGHFVIVTNDGAPEFRLVTAPLADPAAWTVSIAERSDERLCRASVLKDHLVLEVRRDGFPLLRMVDRATGAERSTSRPRLRPVRSRFTNASPTTPRRSRSRSSRWSRRTRGTTWISPPALVP